MDPARQLVRNDFQAQDDLANLRVLHQVLQACALPADAQLLDQYLAKVVGCAPENIDLSEILSRAEIARSDYPQLRTVFASYVYSLANWSTISILSASYLGALTVTRSLLEALVNVGSGGTGNMSDKIAALAFLDPDERQVVTDCWRDLSGWTHGYSRWLKRLCPVLVSRGPLHHPELVRDCTVLIGAVTDFAFTIAIAKLELDALSVRSLCDEMHVDWKRFMMLRRRIERAAPIGGKSAS